MGSPRVRRDPAAPAKGSSRPANAAKQGSAKAPDPAPRRPLSDAENDPKTNTEPETIDAIGAPASKRVLRSQGRRTMRKLLDAAMVAFDKRGYHATRVNDIVDIAKTSHGTFYLYFSNKEDLLRALVAEAAGESQSLCDTLNALPVPDAPPQWEDVFGWVQAYSDLWTRYAPLFRVWTDLATADPELVDMVRQSFTAMSGALSKQIGPDSSGHILDPEAAGMATLAMLDRFHYLREFVGQPIDATALETMTTMVYRALFDPNAYRRDAAVHGYDTAGWVPYFGAMVGATAALTGLLFVAVSLNLDKIVKGPTFLPHRAAETLGVLLLVLYASALVLVPQNIRLLGAEILVAVVPLQVLILRSQLTYRRTRQGDPLLWLVSRMSATAVCTVPALLAGISLAAHWGGGLYWLVPTTILGIAGAAYNAWVLLVEIVR